MERTYIVTPPDAGVLGAADLGTIAWPRANDGGTGDGHNCRDLSRDVVTVGHGENATEFDECGIFGDAFFLAISGGPHNSVALIEVRDADVSETAFEVLNGPIHEYWLAEWRLEAPLYLINTVVVESRRGPRTSVLWDLQRRLSNADLCQWDSCRIIQDFP